MQRERQSSTTNDKTRGQRKNVVYLSIFYPSFYKSKESVRPSVHHTAPETVPRMFFRLAGCAAEDTSMCILSSWRLGLLRHSVLGSSSSPPLSERKMGLYLSHTPSEQELYSLIGNAKIMVWHLQYYSLYL